MCGNTASRRYPDGFFCAAPSTAGIAAKGPLHCDSDGHQRAIAATAGAVYARGGRDRCGGVLWNDPAEMTDEPTPWPQIIGHTPQLEPRCHEGWRWTIDVGAALSGRVAALVAEPGSDWRLVEAESAGRKID